MSEATQAPHGAAATPLDVARPAVLSVRQLKQYFPVKSAGLIHRNTGTHQAFAHQPGEPIMVLDQEYAAHHKRCGGGVPAFRSCSWQKCLRCSATSSR